GTRWGINRTVAQIQALLFLSPEPLHAEQICQTLGVARSNASNSLKELMGWGVVKVTHILGDRRDHFVCLTDPWEMFRIILEERKKREIDPTVALLRECVAMSESEGGMVQERLTETLEFFETTTTWYNQLAKLPKQGLIRFLKLGAKIKGWVKQEA
nr:MarR family transcriptional regulator [Acidobacteriota bacterium]